MKQFSIFDNYNFILIGIIYASSGEEALEKAKNLAIYNELDQDEIASLTASRSYIEIIDFQK